MKKMRKDFWFTASELGIIREAFAAYLKVADKDSENYRFIHTVNSLLEIHKKDLEKIDGR